MNSLFSSAKVGIHAFRSTGIAAAALTLLGFAGSSASAQVGAVFTSTNNANSNAVVRLKRLGNGALTAPQLFYTGGKGTGSGLGSQGAVTVSPNGQYLYAVDAGSNDVAVFRITPDTLNLVGTYPSGGVQPVSITVNGSFVYVLNSGSDTIAGFRINPNGSLSGITGSVQQLSGTGTGAAEIAFTPDGQQLAVTEKGTNKTDVFPVGSDGVAGAAVVTASHGVTPYGFAFDWAGHAIVSEAAGAEAGATSVSSYFVSDFGMLPITGSFPDTQTAACWVAVYGNYAWTTNAASGTISTYNIAWNGRLSLANFGDGSSFTRVPGTGAHPTDMALDANHRFLYTLVPNTKSVVGYKINADGSLTQVTLLSGLVSGLPGLAGL
jgi:6-phosphogluconolactonase